MSSMADLKTRWAALSSGHQRLIKWGLVAMVVAVGLWMWLTAPRYRVLYANLDPADAGQIVEWLKSEKIPYRLEQGGQTVLVPQRYVHEARLQLATAGLPRGGTVGFEILDQTRLGATDFEQRINYLRALQGELARTISCISGVETARVHIVVPEPSLFVGQRQAASAAVFVKMKPLARLTPDQVSGIMHLVAYSVEGLAPEQVTVVDVSGTVLSAAVPAASPGGQAASLLETTRQFQRDLERRLQGMLEQVLGPGNVICRVTAELNFDQRTVTSTLFVPSDQEEAILRSVQELRESFQGTGLGAGAPAGISANIPTYQATAESGTAEYERTEITRNYEVGEQREHLVVAPGSVRRLSVAVVVNGALTPEQQQLIQQAVAAAIGYDEQRKDVITVTGIPFDTAWAEEMQAQMAAAEEQARRQERYRLVGGGVLAFLVLLVGIVAWRRRRRVPAPVPEKVQATEAEAEEEVESPRSRVREQVVQLARQSPDRVAEILKAWLAQE